MNELAQLCEWVPTWPGEEGTGSTRIGPKRIQVSATADLAF